MLEQSLLSYEVLNALKHSGAFGEDELKEIATALNDFQFAIFNLEGEFAEKAVEVAMRRGVAIYDASYVALAQIANAEMFTADGKLLRKVRRYGLVKHAMEFNAPTGLTLLGPCSGPT
ncbi:MAG: PIN domain nuclease [Desulfurococcales archaeon ex4484_204]|nr:MAG: PIN domain nuclease [Desulfurococcales archaeon ex4484_204]